MSVKTISKDELRRMNGAEGLILQGFTDEQFDKAKATGLSDGRLYKMAGNAVSVPVVSAVGAVIKKIYLEQMNPERSISYEL